MTNVGGRTAFINRAANGIGLGTSRAFAREGVKLALIDLDANAFERARDKLSAVADVATAVLDLFDRGAFTRFADKVAAQVGPVSLLVNNAGVAGGGSADHLTYKLREWGMGIDLDGVISDVQTFLLRIVEREPVRRARGRTLSKRNVRQHRNEQVARARPQASGGRGDRALPKPGGGRHHGPHPRHSAQGRPGEVGGSARQRRSALARKGMEDYWALGTLPDAVGDMVRAAASENRMYVHTSRGSTRRIAERGKALLKAVPA